MAKISAGDFRQDELRSGEMRAEGLGSSYLALPATSEIGVWQFKPRNNSAVLLRLPLTRGDWPVIVRRRLDAGSIVQSAISLNLLLSAAVREGLAPGTGTRVKPEIFGIRTLDTPEKQSGQMSMNWSMSWPNLFSPADLITGDAGFRAAGTVLAVVLMFLTIAYGLAATAGTWLVLRRRKMTQHSWLVFGTVAVVGSLGAGFLVQAARGIRAEVKQQSIIDLDAATGMASVHTFYGLRVPYDATVDVALTTSWQDDLPPDEAKEAYVRPASDLRAGTGGTFAVRRDYTIRYGQHELKGRADPGDGEAVRVILVWSPGRLGAGDDRAGKRRATTVRQIVDRQPDEYAAARLHPDLLADADVQCEVSRCDGDGHADRRPAGRKGPQ